MGWGWLTSICSLRLLEYAYRAYRACTHTGGSHESQDAASGGLAGDVLDENLAGHLAGGRQLESYVPENEGLLFFLRGEAAAFIFPDARARSPPQRLIVSSLARWGGGAAPSWARWPPGGENEEPETTSRYTFEPWVLDVFYFVGVQYANSLAVFLHLTRPPDEYIHRANQPGAREAS